MGRPDDAIRALAGRLRHRVGDFFSRVRGFLKEAIVAGALALSGGDLDDEDHAEVDRQHAVQASFLEAFERDVRTFRTPPELSEPSGLALVEPMTARQFAARLEMYGGAVHTSAMEVERRRILDHVRRHGIPVREARFHRKPNPEGHACKTCLGESNKGYVPIGTLLPIGDAECLTSCDCYFVYELADGSKFSTLTGLKKAA